MVNHGYLQLRGTFCSVRGQWQAPSLSASSRAGPVAAGRCLAWHPSRRWGEPLRTAAAGVAGRSPGHLSGGLCIEVGGGPAPLAAALPPRCETGAVGAARPRGGCPT